MSLVSRLVAISYTDTGDRTEFAYDGLGRRVKITEYGPAVSAEIEPKSGYSQYSTDPFDLVTGDYSLKFEGLNPNGGDNTALIDEVMLNNALVTGGGFEDPELEVDTIDPEGSGWNYFGSAGIAAPDGDIAQDGPPAAEANQAAFVMNNGLLWQFGTVTPGNYTLSLQASQPLSGNDSYQQFRVTVRGAISTKTFVWAGNTIAEERDGSGLTVKKRFFAEGEQRIGGGDAGLYYYTRDHLGSVREITDSAGTLIAEYDYDAWGKAVVVSGHMNADFGFTGHYFHQPSGLNLAMYRAYNAPLGRWISRDPLGEEAGLNLYQYVGNDPVELIDLLGLREWFATSFEAASSGARDDFRRAVGGDREWGGFVCKRKCKEDGRHFYYTGPSPGRTGQPPSPAPRAETYSLPNRDYEKCDNGDEAVALHYATPHGVQMPDWDKNDSVAHQQPFMLATPVSGRNNLSRLIPFPAKPTDWPK